MIEHPKRDLVIHLSIALWLAVVVSLDTGKWTHWGCLTSGLVAGCCVRDLLGSRS